VGGATLHAHLKQDKVAGARLTPVILTTQAAEIKRIKVQSQPWEKVSEVPISTNK
jgi:hypothetical protein